MYNTKIVPVKASTNYNVIIGEGLLDNVGKLIKNVKNPCHTVVVTDSNVDELYADRVVESLEKSGYNTDKYVFPAGEGSKTASTFVDILEFFASVKLTRTDLIVALGGGVVGDVVGFASACFLRGVDFVQVPTTLLAAVDSSVGGKTAIDLEAGKNLAGAFYQPKLVICDTKTFDTLDKRQKACGMAEVIKYGILFDKDFYDYLENDNIDMTSVVEKCVIFKRDVVEKDEFDRGERKLLNLGHTAAHGIEKYSGYKLNHGEAVAVGIVIATKIAENMGLCGKDTHKQIAKTLKKHNLPIKHEVDAKTLCDIALSDKKREGAKITLVLPEIIGKCNLVDVNVEELESVFSRAL